jgi:TetR/AcrR family transcriptional repressor of nem operon
MSKGKITRERILGKAAALFNSRGYFGASMSDLMEATGMEKGGIYNHFESKELLALQAFDHAVAINNEILHKMVDDTEGPINKLLMAVYGFAYCIENSPVTGGCPIMNSAVESDDAHPIMREKVREAMANLRLYFEALINDAVEAHQLKLNVSCEQFALVMIAGLEGGVMISRLYGDPNHLQMITRHLQALIKQIATVPVTFSTPDLKGAPATSAAPSVVKQEVAL